jgi:hypothetical protein
LAFPLPVIEQDGADRITLWVATSKHDVSDVNPVAWPVTTVPMGPDVGVSAKVPSGPAVTMNVAVAESPEPMFVVTVTV